MQKANSKNNFVEYIRLKLGCVMNNKNKKNRNSKGKTISKKKKDNLEISGNLLYRKPDDDAIEAEEVYQKPSVPGEYAGDC